MPNRFKEKDIRDLDTMQHYFDLVKKDSEKMLSRINVMEKINQKRWGLGFSEFEFEKNGYIYEKCISSGSLFVNPRPKFNFLMEFYSKSESSKYWVTDFFSPKIEQRREKIFKPRAKKVKDIFSKNLSNMKIGDIGAGFGLFIEELQGLCPKKIDIKAIEPSSEMASICRSKGINVVESMLENLVGEEDRYDLLTTFELFEHLHDPLIFLQDCYQILNPSGFIYLTTLNVKGFDIQLLWEDSNAIFPPHHLNFFNPNSMDKILKLAGFENIQITTPGELDIDIVHNAYKNGNKKIPRFLSSIFETSSSEVLNNFQKFIKENSLSSHMCIIAQKPK